MERCVLRVIYGMYMYVLLTLGACALGLCMHGIEQFAVILLYWTCNTVQYTPVLHQDVLKKLANHHQHVREVDLILAPQCVQTHQGCCDRAINNTAVLV